MCLLSRIKSISRVKNSQVVCGYHDDAMKHAGSGYTNECPEINKNLITLRFGHHTRSSAQI